MVQYACHCRRLRFFPWSGKIPHAMEYYCAPQLLSLHSRACKLPLLSPFSLDPMLHNSEDPVQPKTKQTEQQQQTPHNGLEYSPLPQKKNLELYSHVMVKMISILLPRSLNKGKKRFLFFNKPY